jgi:hypothetical protein
MDFIYCDVSKVIGGIWNSHSAAQSLQSSFVALDEMKNTAVLFMVAFWLAFPNPASSSDEFFLADGQVVASQKASVLIL